MLVTAILPKDFSVFCPNTLYLRNFRLLLRRNKWLSSSPPQEHIFQSWLLGFSVMSPPARKCKSWTPYHWWRSQHWPSLTVSSAFTVLQRPLTSPHLPLHTPYKTSQRRDTSLLPWLVTFAETPTICQPLSWALVSSQMTWVWDRVLQGQEVSTWHFPNFTVCPESPAGPCKGPELLRGVGEIIIF